MTTAFDGVNDLRHDGCLARAFPNYTERPAQLQMARIVAMAIDNARHAAIEAGTGTGKSLAYLLPSLRSGKVALVSTANKALQEQLYYKDIPLLQKHVFPFRAALFKGMGNYVCLERLEEKRTALLAEEQTEEDQQAMKSLVAAINDRIWTGDFESIGAPRLTPELQADVKGDTNACAWKKCPFHASNDCFVVKMRAEARDAQVIIVNHTLLMLNLLAGGKILPEHDVVIIDEAHHLEEEATRAFTITVSDLSIWSLLALKDVRAAVKEDLYQQVMASTKQLWGTLEDRIANNAKLVLTDTMEHGLRLASLLDNVARQIEMHGPSTPSDKEIALHAKRVSRAEKLASDVRFVFSKQNTTQWVRYLSSPGRKRGKLLIDVCAAPLSVANQLREKLFGQTGRCKTVICTSATIATPDLTFFKKSVGLGSSLEAVLPHVFDYNQQAMLYVPRRIPEPAYGQTADAAEYEEIIASEMLKLVQASRGRAFLLFSSKRMMDRVYGEIAPSLQQYEVLKQGDRPRAELIQAFRKARSGVLFGLKSFWEGVDISGEALSMVVIDKLPFAPPDDPVQEARVAMMKAAGENAFMTYILPQVVLMLKQGVGRLIRSSADRGVMAILDARLHTKKYGDKVIQALPPARPVTSIVPVQQFFPSSPDTCLRCSAPSWAITEENIGYCKQCWIAMGNRPEGRDGCDLCGDFCDIVDETGHSYCQECWEKQEALPV